MTVTTRPDSAGPQKFGLLRTRLRAAVPVALRRDVQGTLIASAAADWRSEAAIPQRHKRLEFVRRGNSHPGPAAHETSFISGQHVSQQIFPNRVRWAPPSVGASQKKHAPTRTVDWIEGRCFGDPPAAAKPQTQEPGPMPPQSSHTRSPHDVVFAGGGPCGIAAAWIDGRRGGEPPLGR